MLSFRELFINLSGLLRPIAARYAPPIQEQLRPLDQPSMRTWNRRLGIAIGMAVALVALATLAAATHRLTLRRGFRRTRRGCT